MFYLSIDIRLVTDFKLELIFLESYSRVLPVTL